MVIRWLENRLVYRPRKAEESWADPPCPEVRDVWLSSAEGTRLHAWFLPREGGAGAVLVSHGNGGNLSHRGAFVVDLCRRRSKRSARGVSQGPTAKALSVTKDRAAGWCSPPSWIKDLPEAIGETADEVLRRLQPFPATASLRL
ncbi:MAG TPA: hypothetical protein VKA46_11715 [Gemmataceae bacterium]|nr:hypothetical protein [Gemmataceae bacterium]